MTAYLHLSPLLFCRHGQMRIRCAQLGREHEGGIQRETQNQQKEISSPMSIRSSVPSMNPVTPKPEGGAIASRGILEELGSQIRKGTSEEGSPRSFEALWTAGTLTLAWGGEPRCGYSEGSRHSTQRPDSLQTPRLSPVMGG